VNGEAWSLRLTRRAEKEMARLDPPVRQRITNAIRALAIKPDQATGVRKLSGQPGSRLRVGDWRVLFEINRERHEIVIYRVQPRGRAYDR
jgi:mRNA interferase RelE/StbE